MSVAKKSGGGGGELIWFSTACEKLIESQNSIVFIIK